MLVSVRDSETPTGAGSGFSMRSVLLAVGRRSLPHLLEATFIPAVLFYFSMMYLGTGAAMVIVLGWTYGAVFRRLVQGHRIPGVLILATIGLTVRTVVGILSGSAFMYFIQPVATTVVLAARVPRLGARRASAHRAPRRRLLPDGRRDRAAARRSRISSAASRCCGPACTCSTRPRPSDCS